MENKYLWSFYFDCGRMGGLDGLFVATEQEVEDIIGKEASFGEVLGKHSDVSGTIDSTDISKINISSEAVLEVSKHLGDTWSGFNPLEYVQVQCENIIDGDQCEETGSKEDMDTGLEGYNYLCYDCETELLKKVLDSAE